jgi:uncharacterized protein (DUF4415 family)
MTPKYLTQKEFKPGRSYSREDWDAIDSPELTDEELARMRPARDVLPQAFFDSVDEARHARGRPRLEAQKIAVTLRIEPDVLEKFKHAGADWRARMTKALRKAAGL